MVRFLRSVPVLALVTAFLPGVANADVVENDILSHNGTDRIGPGETLLVAYSIRISTNDPEAGCNAADGTPATLHILPSSPNVSATPDMLTFSACDAPQTVELTSSVLGNYRINLALDDASGVGRYNVGGATFTLHVEAPASDPAPVTLDTTAPTLALPGTLGAEATGPDGATVTYGASASDDTDGGLAIACSPPSGSLFPLGTTTVTCTATDAAGNTATGSFDVTVSDTTAPALSLPASAGAEATGPDGATVTYEASASDLVDGATSVDCTPASGSTFPVGDTEVTCTSTDAAGNTASGSFWVHVVDTTPPDVTVPAWAGAEATGPSGAAVTFSSSASDLVDGATATDCSPASGSTFPLGDTEVTCTSTDAHGNTGSASFLVTVTDTTPPALAAPADVFADATSGSGATVSYAVTAYDLVDGAIAASCSPASGSFFPLGATTVTCTATDAHGNAAGPVSFQVHVALNCTGPLPPIKADGKSVFKFGSTIPIKCQPAGGSAGVSNATIRISLRQINSAAPSGDVTATSTSAADTGNVMRWDPTGQQYIYNLATKPLAKGTWEITLDLGGGNLRTVRVGLK